MSNIKWKLQDNIHILTTITTSAQWVLSLQMKLTESWRDKTLRAPLTVDSKPNTALCFGLQAAERGSTTYTDDNWQPNTHANDKSANKGDNKHVVLSSIIQPPSLKAYKELSVLSADAFICQISHIDLFNTSSAKLCFCLNKSYKTVGALIWWFLLSCPA